MCTMILSNKCSIDRILTGSISASYGNYLFLTVSTCREWVTPPSFHPAYFHSALYQEGWEYSQGCLHPGFYICSPIYWEKI